MKNRELSVGICGAVVGLMIGVVAYTSTHGTFSVVGSTLPVAMRIDEVLHGSAFEFAKRNLANVKFYDKPTSAGSSSSSASGPLADTTLCDTVTTIMGDIKTVVTNTIPTDLRFRKFLKPILRKLAAVNDEYCEETDSEPAKPVKFDNDCEKYPDRARYTTCKRYEEAGTVYP